MYIKTVIVDGFKSYGKRTIIGEFDKEFTAITGLNGTGKSNILDSICFVLGISQLSHVRANSLQDLIFKSGQAGIKKASVTIFFDNSDADQCPLGYEKCREISVTRQIIMGGKSKFLINGKNVMQRQIEDLFRSVQLNINNPSFLIMQGRITKVLNMKPQEILSMIEEAAGTSLYESKKEASCKLIERKECKVRETDTLLKEEVEPKLEKLRQERSRYNTYQKMTREIEYLTRLSVSYNYLQHKKESEKIEKVLEKLSSDIQNYQKQITDNENLIIQRNSKIEEIQGIIDNASGNELKELETTLLQKQKEEAAKSGKMKGLKETVDEKTRKINSLIKSIKDDETALSNKQKQMQNFELSYKNLKEKYDSDQKSYENAKKKIEAVSQGLSTNEEGEAKTLQDQLITAQSQIKEAQTKIKRSDMDLKHLREVLKKKMNEAQTSDAAYLKDKEVHDQIENEIKKLSNEIKKINYTDGTLENYEQQQIALNNEVKELRSKLHHLQAYRFDLQYTDPEPNFDRRKLHGMVGKLFNVKDKRNFVALTAAGGGSIYSYVTDDEETSKKILQRGQLQNRVTMIPMNKISSSAIPPNIVNFAQTLVGKEQVTGALSLIDYIPLYDRVMKFVFGRSLVCKDINVAKQVTYHKKIGCRSVTLDGDNVDPDGVLSGGSRQKGPNVLQEIFNIKSVEEQICNKQQELLNVEQAIQSISRNARNFNTLKERLEFQQHELNMCKQRLAGTKFQQSQDEVESLKARIESLQQDLINAKETENNASKKVEDIKMKLADANGYRERELKSAQNEMAEAKKRCEASNKIWKKHEQSYETLKLEIDEIEKGIEAAKIQQKEQEDIIQKLKQELIEYQEKQKEFTKELNELKNLIKKQKDQINAQSKDLRACHAEQDKLRKQNNELKLAIKKKEIELTKIQGDVKNKENLIKSMENQYQWIKEDFEFFGVKNTRYDYSKEDPTATDTKLNNLIEEKNKLERHLNLQAMSVLEREEDQYKETIRKKKIVEDDKKKLEIIIHRMDEQKKEKLENAWQEVNRNFGSIFSTLLPGAQARLLPVYQNRSGATTSANANATLTGLQISVGFNNVWKDSLSELSGGQRSLIALSLILAMLKFSPAPLYILDEVDAALDMSHTQNIGNMLRQHFRNSQFIIVSLKDGMFNNANVLFRTKFEEGVSGVTRIVNTNRKK